MENASEALKRADEASSRSDHEDAVSLYSVVIHNDPTNYKLYLKRSMANIYLGRYEQALFDCQTSVKIFDKNHEVGDFVLFFN